MDYEDLVEDPKPEPPYEVADVEAVAPEIVKRGPGWKAVIATGVLAGLIGAGGGAAAIYAGVKAQTPDMSEMRAELRRDMSAEIATALSELETRVSAAETVAKTAERRAANRSTPISTPVDLSPLESRIAALETAPSPEIDPDALAALQAAQADGFDWPDTAQIEAVLTRFDARLTDIEESPEKLAVRDGNVAAENSSVSVFEDLEDRVAALESAPVPDISLPADVMTRIEALETRPEAAAEKQVVPVLAFPKDAMLRAVNTTTTGGFFERTLSKHVRVKDGDDPRALIDGIETDISKGRLDLALNKYDRLPSPVREAGRAWYVSVKAAQ